MGFAGADRHWQCLVAFCLDLCCRCFGFAKSSLPFLLLQVPLTCATGLRIFRHKSRQHAARHHQARSKGVRRIPGPACCPSLYRPRGGPSRRGQRANKKHFTISTSRAATVSTRSSPETGSLALPSPSGFRPQLDNQSLPAAGGPNMTANHTRDSRGRGWSHLRLQARRAVLPMRPFESAESLAAIPCRMHRISFDLRS